MLQIAICDDESACVSDLETLLKKYFPSGVTYELFKFSSGEDFLNAFHRRRLDILFMDIELVRMNGIETVRRLRAEQSNCIVFFVTSHNNYIADAFRLNSFQFLQKPINEEDFKVDIERAIEQYAASHNTLEIESNGLIKKVPIVEIYYIEVSGRHVEIHLIDQTLTSTENIKYFTDRLCGFGFAKTHYSFIVNMQHVIEIGKDTVALDSGESVILSRRYRNSFVHEYHKYCIGRCL